MNTIALILKEIRHRKLNFTLMGLGIVTAVALFVAYMLGSAASGKELSRITRDTGPNLRIVPEAADVHEVLLHEFDSATMPLQVVDALTRQRNVAYNHLTAILYRRMPLNGVEVILAGMAESRSPVGAHKPTMFKRIDPGTAMIGAQVAEALGVKRGGTITIGNQTFTVSRVMVPENTDKDFTVYVDLAQLQNALETGPVISEIHAIDCTNCVMATADPTPLLQAELDTAGVAARVLRLNTQADMRSQLRQTAARYFSYATPFVIGVCAIWVAAAALANVRQRREEIGVLRALGFGSSRIASMFLGKAVLAGLLGAGIGFAIGAWLAVTFGPRVFEVTANSIHPDYNLLLRAAIAAPLFAALVSLLPTLSAVMQDPAVTLRQE